MLHAYLSAFAFLSLLFFSVTGLMLNHPDWFPGRKKDEPTRVMTISPCTLEPALKGGQPPAALGAVVARQIPVTGVFKSGEVLDGEALLRWEGAGGSTDAAVNLATGRTEVTLQRAPLAALLGDLHKGKNTGGPWRALIDVSAILILALSAIGYVLFFSLRFRLKTSLILTAVSLGAMLGIFYLLVP
jgi:hypothetical protein